ncbi:MAG: CRISPR locus-related DNA-binding protein [Sulfolobus sp.]|nr:CRISPR locus-related DNA-binding protein [Sulfolobus sp.]
MYLITTLGFDEKFQVRSVMRHGNELEKVVIVKPKDDNEKARKALENFQELLNRLGIPNEVLEIDVNDFTNAVVSIAKKVFKMKDKKIVVNISGGMRALIVELISTFLITGIMAEFELETEDFKSLITFSSLDIKYGNLGTDELNILLAVKRGFNTVNKVKNYLNIPLTTAWRRIKKLESEGCITRKDDKLSLTVRGTILSEIYESLEKDHENLSRKMKAG